MNSFKFSRALVLAVGLFSAWIVAAQTSESSDKAIGDLSVSELEQLIDSRIDARLEELGVQDEAMKERIQQGIIDFVEQQRQANDPSRLAKNVRPVSKEEDHIYGDPDAEVSLIEYSDFDCPFCKRFHPTARQLVDESDGRVNWVYRHFPILSIHPGAGKKSVAVECAAELGGREAFWQFTDAIYERASGRGFPESQLLPLAVELELDEQKFTECLNSQRHNNRIQRDLVDGQKSGISGTPGNIILNNKTGDVAAVSGAQPLEALKRAVEEVL